ncbi:MAG TPA: DUF6427 family protein [Flavobacteriales bacterium]
MLVALFRRNQPAALLLLPLLVAALWPGGTPFGTSAPVSSGSGMPLYRVCMHLLEGHPWALSITGALLVLGLAVLVNAATNGVDLFGTYHYLPALVFPGMLALLPYGLRPDPAIMGMPFVLWAMWNTWSTGSRSGGPAPYFDAGLLLGIAGMFYLPYLFVVVAVWACLSVMRPFQWREYLLPLLGALTILFLTWGSLYISGHTEWRPLLTIRADHPARPWSMHWMHRFVLMCWAVCCGAITALSFSGSYARSVMQGKNMRASFLAFSFTLALLAAFEYGLDGAVPPVLLAVPCAVLFSYPLSRAARIGWAEAGVWSLLLLAAWGRWMG